MLQHGEPGHVEGPVALGREEGTHLLIRNRLARRVDQADQPANAEGAAWAAVWVWVDESVASANANAHALQGFEEAMRAVLPR